jgi:hypothetical protein
MRITKATGEYILRCFSAGNLLPNNRFCEECETVFLSAFDAEQHHGVIRHSDGRFTIIIACEGYHQIRFDD